jgi:hypothetical protein
LVIKVKSTEEATSAVDIGPVIQAGISAALGDYKAALTAIVARPPAPSVQDIMTALEKEDGGTWSPEAMGMGGAAGGMLLLALREYLAHKKTAKDNDEAWERLATKDQTKDNNAPAQSKS